VKLSPNALRACAAALFLLAGIALFGIGKAESAAETAKIRMLLQPRNVPAVRDVGWRRVGPELTALHEDYQDYLESNAPVPFRPEHPAVRVIDDRVIIDAVADSDADELVAALKALGAVHVSRFKRMVSARFPLAAIPQLANVTSLRFAQPAMAMTRVGSVDSQGDAAMMSDAARNTFGVDGTGINVGVLSDSFNCLGGAAAGVASGDVPPNYVVFDDSICPGTDEARAMTEIILDVAPGVSIGVHTAFGGQADFALGIEELAGCPPGSEIGCSPIPTYTSQVIVDDVGYFAEPMYMDGIIAQAVDLVTQGTASYLSASGNSGRASYEAPFNLSGVITATGRMHDFDTGPGVDNFLNFTVPAGLTPFSVQWDELFFSLLGPPGSASDARVCIYNDPVSAGLIACTTFDNTGGDPYEGFSLSAGGTFTGNLSFEVLSGPDPNVWKMVAFDSRVTFNEHATHSPTNFGHPNAAGAMAVGAAFWEDTPAFGTDPAILESYSSAGGTPILIDQTGNYTMTVRYQPAIVATDCTDNTFLGSDDGDVGTFPNFCGTSASAPHAAGVAALMASFTISGTGTPPRITHWGIKDVMQSTAGDMGATGFDFDSGAGFVVVPVALDTIDPTSTTCGPETLVLASGPPGGGTFNASEVITYTVPSTNTTYLPIILKGGSSSPAPPPNGVILANGAVLQEATVGHCP
jgi:hypothetical protein